MQKFKEFGQWIAEQTGHRCLKIALDGGFSCPGRDGSRQEGGCTFCNNAHFSPAYSDARRSITEQLETGKRFLSHKAQGKKFLAYFQAYSSTYAPLERCRVLYEEALSVNDVVGIVISTRPDCVSPALLDYLAQLSRRTFVLLEFGVESANDATLRHIHRGHDFACSVRAIREAASRGIHVGAHIILGLPGEDRAELLRQADEVARLPLTTLKLHQLQIVRGTVMEQEYAQAPWPLLGAEEYADLVADYLRPMPAHLVLDRFVSQCPRELLVAPRWGLKADVVTEMVRRRLAQE